MDKPASPSAGRAAPPASRPGRPRGSPTSHALKYEKPKWNLVRQRSPKGCDWSAQGGLSGVADGEAGSPGNAWFTRSKALKGRDKTERDPKMPRASTHKCFQRNSFCSALQRYNMLFCWQDVVWVAGKARDLFSALQTVNILAFPTIFSGAPPGLGSNRTRLPASPSPPGAPGAPGRRNQQSAICNSLAGEARAAFSVPARRDGPSHSGNGG